MLKLKKLENKKILKKRLYGDYITYYNQKE